MRRIALILTGLLIVSLIACDQSTTVSVPGEPDSTGTETIPCPAETIWAPAETVWVVTVEPDSGWWPPGWRKNKK